MIFLVAAPEEGRRNRKSGLQQDLSSQPSNGRSQALYRLSHRHARILPDVNVGSIGPIGPVGPIEPIGPGGKSIAFLIKPPTGCKRRT